ncbi:BRO-N domain-containing protein [Arsenophonus apicola]|uniref:BRO-N domain-containing protein n=3 Tax=Arsenophonus apicola TaxID=2879119 RepID=UPI001CDB85C5|nr:BRO family protein [Arsenophonus apicola]UBX27921.1 hypothetical protein LDL57_08490 [Arsenophonus apicola]
MSKTLVFKNIEVMPFDNRDGKIWFTSTSLASLLEYADVKSVSKIYSRNKDEFTDEMSRVVKMTTCDKSKGYDNWETEVRIFSLRGAHLIGMLSKTKVAKALRKWLLDLAEKESHPANLALLDMEGLKSLTIGEMQNRLVAANKWSFDNFGRKGSDLMNLRKRHLNKIRKAEKTIMALSQLRLPGFDDTPNGESQA